MAPISKKETIAPCIFVNRQSYAHLLGNKLGMHRKRQKLPEKGLFCPMPHAKLGWP